MREVDISGRNGREKRTVSLSCIKNGKNADFWRIVCRLMALCCSNFKKVAGSVRFLRNLEGLSQTKLKKH